MTGIALARRHTSLARTRRALIGTYLVFGPLPLNEPALCLPGNQGKSLYVPPFLDGCAWVGTFAEIVDAMNLIYLQQCSNFR